MSGRVPYCFNRQNRLRRNSLASLYYSRLPLSSPSSREVDVSFLSFLSRSINSLSMRFSRCFLMSTGFGMKRELSFGHLLPPVGSSWRRAFITRTTQPHLGLAVVLDAHSRISRFSSSLSRLALTVPIFTLRSLDVNRSLKTNRRRRSPPCSRLLSQHVSPLDKRQRLQRPFQILRRDTRLADDIPVAHPVALIEQQEDAHLVRADVELTLGLSERRSEIRGAMFVNPPNVVVDSPNNSRPAAAAVLRGCGADIPRGGVPVVVPHGESFERSEPEGGPRTPLQSGAERRLSVLAGAPSWAIPRLARERCPLCLEQPMKLRSTWCGVRR